MAANHRSKRFIPTSITEKIVPILLVILVLILAVVFVIVGLSLVGIFPTA